MRFVRFHDVTKFGEHVFPTLLQKEAQNNLMISIVKRGMQFGGAEEWLMATVEEEGGIRLVALMTPPRNLLIAGSDDPDVLNLLCQNLTAIPGVLAEKQLARAFAKRYGGTFNVHMEERAYEIKAVQPVKRKGDLRPANERDMHFLPYWYKAFEDEAFGTVNALKPEEVREHIRRGNLYVLDVDGLPVCMAGNCRSTPTGEAVGPVYTPPFLRGNGYATDAVAQLSQRLLDEGAAFCALFTDLSNPCSNSAYLRAGYRPVCDFTELHLEGE